MRFQSINLIKPKPESPAVLKILDSTKAEEGKEGRPKMIRKARLIQELEKVDNN